MGSSCNKGDLSGDGPYSCLHKWPSVDLNCEVVKLIDDANGT